MSKSGREPRPKRMAGRARKMASRARRMAGLTASVEHDEDLRAREIVRSQAAARILDMLDPPQPGRAPAPKLRKAVLIINSKSGPQRDSLLRVRELVDLLAHHGIAADVRVKLHKSQARRDARAAAKDNVPLVIAAGGDGTVAAVARGLIGSQTVLGIVPLGTYNNVATSLGIPRDVAQACALIAAGPVRAIDVGEVRAEGMRRARAFLEVGAVGIAAPLAVAGQGFEKGRWDAVTKHLPAALEMSPTVLGVRVDGEHAVHRALSMLAVVANTPRAGAGLLVAPNAKVDDGLLDVRVYEEMSQAGLATHFLAVKTVGGADDLRVRRWSGRDLTIRSTVPLPVVVDSKVVGMTPAHFRVLTGALLVVAGDGDALSRPASHSLVSVVENHRDATPAAEVATQTNGVATSTGAARLAGLNVAREAGPLCLAIAAGAAVAVLPTLSRWFGRRRRSRQHVLAHLLPLLWNGGT